MDALSHMTENTNLQPDARTFTSLISTVARRDTRASGKKDPDLAFSLFDEMTNVYNIKPNGMTYCALIDVCGRCGRSDLALKGLRMMLREKAKRHDNSSYSGSNSANRGNHSKNKLEQEVGAWSAAINACGKAGRLDTAIRIFTTMSSKFGVKPNIITCGTLMDCLLKSGKSEYLEEALNVLSYMKEEGIEPSEVMYTSLITSAGRLAMMENKERGEIVLTDFGDRSIQRGSNNEEEGENRMKALDVYEGLLLSLTNSKRHSSILKPGSTSKADASNNLVKAFLVFQEMKATGADPDIACYNALLRVCAESGDVPKLKDVMRRIKVDRLVPNDTTWKEYLRGAAKAKQSELADEIWNNALRYSSDDTDDNYSYTLWTPKTNSFILLLSSYFVQAKDEESTEKQIQLYHRLMSAYVGVLNSEEERGFHHVDIERLHDNRRAMMMIHHAANNLLYCSSIDVDMDETIKEGVLSSDTLRRIIEDIDGLDCLKNSK